MDRTTLPVVVIGAGPVGLAAAAHLLEQGETPLVLEAGPSAGASVLQWGHVRIFSPWFYNVDKAAVRLLERHDWRAPRPPDYPTGRDLVEQYLSPLAALQELAPHIHYHRTVTGIARHGMDKLKTTGRERAPFVLTVTGPEGQGEAYFAKAVIDASGTYTTPNPLGAHGLPALGERGAAAHIYYGIPDVLGAQRARYAGRRALVVGAGHSAFNALVDLVRLADEAPGTRILWALRKPVVLQNFGGGADDQLQERGKLGTRVQAMIDSGAVEVIAPFGVTKLRRTAQGVVVSSEERELPAVDEIIATTGFRPNLELLRELRLDIDPAVEAPRALAPLIDPNVHSCGSVPPHGAHDLQQPEPDFYIAGMKSYGRAPTFLMLTGYEQVRSIAAAIAGDWESARNVELVLPETGVCNGGGAEQDACGLEPTAKPKIRLRSLAVAD
jgi:thioredoxin reductase